MGEDRPKAFICHAHKDKERFVTDFAEQLRNAGVDAWYDEWEMEVGDSLSAKIFGDTRAQGAIDQADNFIIILSRNSLQSNWVQEEFRQGLAQKISGKAKLLPVVLDVSHDEVPPPLQDIYYEEIEDLDNYDSEFLNILHSILGIENRNKPPLGELPLSRRSSSNAASTQKVSFQIVARLEADRWDDGGDFWEWEAAPRTPRLTLKLAGIERVIQVEKVRFDTRVQERIEQGVTVQLDSPKTVLPGKQTPLRFDMADVLRKLYDDADITSAKEIRAVAIDVLGGSHDSSFVEIHRQWSSLRIHDHKKEWAGTAPEYQPELDLGYVEAVEVTEESDPELYEKVMKAVRLLERRK